MVGERLDSGVPSPTAKPGPKRAKSFRYMCCTSALFFFRELLSRVSAVLCVESIETFSFLRRTRWVLMTAMPLAKASRRADTAFWSSPIVDRVNFKNLGTRHNFLFRERLKEQVVPHQSALQPCPPAWPWGSTISGTVAQTEENFWKRKERLYHKKENKVYRFASRASAS